MLLVINNAEFAQQLKQISGECQLSEMTRLIEILASINLQAVQKNLLSDSIAATTVKYTLKGLPAKHYDDMALPMLMLELSAEMPMICQRCLEVMKQSFALSYRYAICTDAPEALQDDDDVDWLEDDMQMDLQVLIEDELMMAMPIAPVHEYACSELKMQSGEVVNPFAVLKGKF